MILIKSGNLNFDLFEFSPEMCGYVAIVEQVSCAMVSVDLLVECSRSWFRRPAELGWYILVWIQGCYWTGSEAYKKSSIVLAVEINNHVEMGPKNWIERVESPMLHHYMSLLPGIRPPKSTTAKRSIEKNLNNSSQNKKLRNIPDKYKEHKWISEG